MPTLRQAPVRATAAALSLFAVALLPGCSAQQAQPKSEETTTPHDARDTLVETIKHTAGLLDVDGWNEDESPDVGSCTSPSDGRINYTYGYGAPQPGRDHLADAKKIATYWKSIGMTVRIVTQPDPAVYATGGQLSGVRFNTAPGDYYIAGTSRCVPGDLDNLDD